MSQIKLYIVLVVFVFSNSLRVHANEHAHTGADAHKNESTHEVKHEKDAQDSHEHQAPADEPSHDAHTSNHDHHDLKNSDNAHSESAEHAVSHQNKSSFWQWLALKEIYNRFFEKIDHLRQLDEENAELRRRLGELEVKKAVQSYAKVQNSEEEHASKIKVLAKKEGGTEESRTVSSLESFEPGLLSMPPGAIYKKALSAYEKQDYETAAKGFLELTLDSENEYYQNAQVYFFTGVSLFHLRNYKKALFYFEKIDQMLSPKEGHQRSPAQINELSYGPRAKSWEVLCYKKLGDLKSVKRKISELIQEYPRSKEARSMNR